MNLFLNRHLITFLTFVLLCLVSQDMIAQRKGRSRRRQQNNAKTAYKKQENIKPEKPTITLDEAKSQINRIYDETFDDDQVEQSNERAQNAIATYFITLPLNVQSLVQSSYYTDFINACSEENPEGALSSGFKYLLVGGRNDKSTIFTVLTTIFGANNEATNLSYIIKLFEEYSVENNQLYADTIKEIEKNYDEVLHPKTFDEVLLGKWVSVDNISSLHFDTEMSVYVPQFILNIKNVDSGKGVILEKAPSLNDTSRKTGKTWCQNTSFNQLSISQSFLVNEESQNAVMLFASEKINSPQTAVAHQGIENTRHIEATAKARIWSDDKKKIGEKILDDAGATIISSLANSIYGALAVGSKTVEEYVISFTNPTSKTMDATVNYQKVKEKTNGNRKLIDTKKNKATKFVKWEESDSVIFIHNGKPLFAGQYLHGDSPLLKEYNAVRKKYNIWKPQYLIPAVVSVGVGTFCLTKCFRKTPQDLSDDEKAKRIKEDCTYMIIGAIVPVLGVNLVIKAISSKRKAVYNKINQKSLEKMRKKAATLSLSPSIDPIDNALGVNMNFKF